MKFEQTRTNNKNTFCINDVLDYVKRKKKRKKKVSNSSGKK